MNLAELKSSNIWTTENGAGRTRGLISSNLHSVMNSLSDLGQIIFSL